MLIVLERLWGNQKPDTRLLGLAESVIDQQRCLEFGGTCPLFKKLAVALDNSKAIVMI
ncbi:MAG: hypothetical protein PHW13_03235 [Methylococcales bacterium]|nr:hypothetical protein [Methylococcales bacterium]